MRKYIYILLMAVGVLAFASCGKESGDDEGDENGSQEVDYNLLSSYYELGSFTWGESKELLKGKQTAKFIEEGKDGDITFVSYQTGRVGAKITFFFKQNKLYEIGLDDMDGKYAGKILELMNKKYVGTSTQLNKTKYEFRDDNSRIYHEVFGYNLLAIWFEPKVGSVDAYYTEPMKSWVATKADVKAFEKRKLSSEISDALKYTGAKQESEAGYFFNKSGTVERSYVILPGSLNSKVLEALTWDYGKPIYDEVTRDYLYTWQREVLFRINGMDVYYYEYEDSGRHITVYYSWQNRWEINQ